MLAQLFLTPSGMILEAAATAAAGADVTFAAVVSPLLSASSDFAVSNLDASSVFSGLAFSQAFDSVVGTETSLFSLRVPLVCAVEAPRALPPLPRSLPRPRPL